MTWRLRQPRPNGSSLWVQVLDPVTNEWYPTGEAARVTESGMHATARVLHFSTIGIADDIGIVTEWVWLFSIYEDCLERLARVATSNATSSPARPGILGSI